jgi:PAS domain S-box-containing protein
MQSGVFVLDANDNIIYLNEFMAERAGASKEEIIGTNMLETGNKFPEGEFSEIQQQYQLAKKHLKPVSFTNVPVTTPAGELVYQSGGMTPRLKDGQFVGMVMTLNDTTKSQELSQLLSLSLENSENAIGVIKQPERGGEVEGFFMNKKMRQLFDLDGLRPEKDSFNKVHNKTGKHILNRKEWEEFSKANLKLGRAKAELIIDHVNGKRYKWKSAAMMDENDVYCGRMIQIRKTKSEKN